MYDIFSKVEEPAETMHGSDWAFSTKSMKGNVYVMAANKYVD